MTAYTVQFDRIGRTHNPAPLVATVDDDRAADELAEKIHRHARGFLRSSDYEVNVDLARGRGSIELGRFGTFTVEARP